VNQARLLLGHFRSHESIRKQVIKEAKLIIENQKRKLQKIINLEYKEGNPPDTAYMEADATYITLQKKGKEKGGKLEVKLGVGYTGKEARCSSGKSKRLKEKFTFVGIVKDFMEKLSLIAEEWSEPLRLDNLSLNTPYIPENYPLPITSRIPLEAYSPKMNATSFYYTHLL